jgi:hypothetical protein
MDLTEIVSIAGKPGLHKIVGRRPAGLIIESLEEKPKRAPSSIHQKISILEDISVFTYGEDVKLREVLIAMHKAVKDGLKLIDKKDDGSVIRDFFRKVLPEFDEDQVYTSDIIKIASWYKILSTYTNLDELKSETESTDAKSSEEEE